MIPDMPGNDSPRSDPPHATPWRLARDAPNGSADAAHHPPAADKPTARDQTPAPGTDAGVQSGEAPSGIRSQLKRLPLRQIIVFAIAIVGLYFVWPQLVSLFSQVPAAARHLLALVCPHGRLEAASFACAWGLMRLALGERSWFLIATAQLTEQRREPRDPRRRRPGRHGELSDVRRHAERRPNGSSRVSPPPR